jgi:hypothetical protein
MAEDPFSPLKLGTAASYKRLCAGSVQAAAVVNCKACSTPPMRPQRGIDRLVLGHARQALERGRHDMGGIVIAIAGKIGDGHLRIRQRGADHRLDLGRPSPSGFAHQLAARIDRLGVHRRADFGLVGFDTGRYQIAQQLADHVLVTGFLEIRLDDGLGIGFGFRGIEAHALGTHCPSRRLRRA